MSAGSGHQPNDHRPQSCRNRLRDEGRAYPRSGCDACGNGGMMGCPHERRADPPSSGSGVKPPQQPDQHLRVERLSVLDLRPSDLLVVEVPQILTTEAHARAHELVTKATGHSGPVLILHGGAKIGVVRPVKP